MGGLVNAGIRRERWERVDIPGQNTPLIMPEIGIQPPEIPAQDSVSVTPGIGVQPPGPLAFENRVRITTENGEKLIGHLKEYDADSLTLLTGFTEQSIAYTDMARLQRSLGIRSYSRDAAMTGLAVGVGGSIAVAAILQDGWAAILGIGFFTPALGLGGMISGRAIRRERWKRLDIPDQDAAFVMPDTDDRPGSQVTLENRMRVTTKNGEKLIGQVKGYDADSLTILTDSKEQSIAYTDMARLHRSLGVRSHVLKGTLIGLGAGMIVGISGASNIECNNESCVGEAIAATGIFLLGSGGGTLLGALVGVANRTERWKRVDIPDQSAVSITPVIGVHPGGRLALGARISF